MYPASSIPRRTPSALYAGILSMMTMSPGAKVGTRTCCTGLECDLAHRTVMLPTAVLQIPPDLQPLCITLDYLVATCVKSTLHAAPSSMTKGAWMRANSSTTSP